MYAIEKIKKEIIKQLNDILGSKILKVDNLVYPPQAGFGDLSLPCFELAKEIKKSPVEVANDLLSEIASLEGINWGANTVGPYLNFKLNIQELAKEVFKNGNKMEETYGYVKIGKKKRVMIEYSNVNTHKQYHVGHLRNICYGDSVTRILTANGYETIPVSYINDFGIHVAKTLWAYLEFYKDIEIPKNKGYFLGQIYVRSVEEMEKNPLAKDMVSFMMKKIESRKGKEYKLWQKTRKWSIEQFDKIYKELGVKFEAIFYENDFMKEGMDMVEALYKKRLLTKSDGAIIADLEEYGLNVLMFLRSDGTAMYPVADLPLARRKFDKYKLDASIYVVDIRQSLYFKQLFKVLEKLGYKQEMVHLGHDYVKLPSGMMSSRSGTVITYEELSEEVFNKAALETRSRHSEWSDKKVNEVATAIKNGAIKFEMIKSGADQVISFDINQALRFDGYTAAYLQYTYARMNSIVKKSESNKYKIDCNVLKEKEEHSLILKISKYPEAVISAGKNYNPSEIVRYAQELARDFNDYYHKIPILKAEDEKLIGARLELLKAVKQTVKNSLELLGIDVVEEM